MRISVVTACFNSASTISDTLRSVNDQTYGDVEHVVIDGGSADATLATVKAQGRRVGRLVSEPDGGIYDAMNKGIRAATGDVVGMLNSDDFYATPEALARVAAAFEDPRVDACYGDLCYVGREDKGRIVRYWQSGLFRPGMFANGWEPPHPTFFARRALYERLGLFKTDYVLAADTELMARFIEVHGVRTAYLPEVLVHMRMGGVSNRSLRNVIHQNQEVLHALRAHGMRPSVGRFVLSKVGSRTRQFISRPTPASSSRGTAHAPSTFVASLLPNSEPAPSP